MDTVESRAQDISLGGRILRRNSYEDVCKSLGKPKVFVFSTPHGKPADACVDAISPFLVEGDIIIDCGNEHWHNTARRQRHLDPLGIHYVGCGVSGGYQSARHGPSMSPGGTPAALEKVIPFLESIAAKDDRGRACTVPVGPGPSGHYVKMVHNGIEQGMMSVIAEVWIMLKSTLGLGDSKIADIFHGWNSDGLLRGCFLVAIGVDIERARDRQGRSVLDQVQDKVVQDVDEEEGTGIWTAGEAVRLHSPAATVMSAHLFRCASANLGRRQRNKKSARGGVQPRSPSVASKEHFIELLHRATYFCFLACFTQGLDIIHEQDRQCGWKLDFAQLLQLWRGGCIIQADHIVDLLQRMYKRAD
jgi:6-phosphogluconate dehydrogenase